jgi:hypothetical protein
LDTLGYQPGQERTTLIVNTANVTQKEMNRSLSPNRFTDAGLDGNHVVAHELAINNDRVGVRVVRGQNPNHRGPLSTEAMQASIQFRILIAWGFTR